jgi:hypothetical protein
VSPNHYPRGDHDPLREALRAVLLVAVESMADAADGIDSIQSRACAALYVLLMHHPIDRQGRCRLCPRPRALPGFRRRCQVRTQARFWLQQPAQFLTSQLINELGLSRPPTTEHRTLDIATGNRVPTDTLARIEPDSSAYLLETPAFPSRSQPVDSAGRDSSSSASVLLSAASRSTGPTATAQACPPRGGVG